MDGQQSAQAAAVSGTMAFGQTTYLPNPLTLDISDRFTLATSWRVWKQRWDAFAVVSDLASKSDSYKVSMLISCIGDEALTVINALPYAAESDRKDLSKVLKLLEEFCFAGENIMYERYKFYQRQQEEGEPIETFITALRTMARTCAFTEDGKDFLAQMIRDRLVCGMRDGAVRRKLLSKDSQPNLETCIKESRSAAAAVHQAQRMQGLCDSINIAKKGEWPECGYCGRRHQRGQRFLPCIRENLPKLRQRESFLNEVSVNA